MTHPQKIFTDRTFMLDNMPHTILLFPFWGISADVRIEEHEIAQIADKVKAFHDQLSSEGFIELQKKCRAFWEDYLSPYGFFANFYRHFE